MTEGVSSISFEALDKFAVPSVARSIFQLANSAVGFVLGWVAMLWLLDVSYWLTLLVAIPTVGFLVRLFIIFHDCGHGSFFRSRRANGITGAILGVLFLTPYDAWRRRHAAHHGSTGDLDGDRSLGSFRTMTVDEYRRSTRGQRLFYRVYRSPLVLFCFGALFHFVIGQRFPQRVPPSFRKIERRSVLWTDVGIITAIVALVSLVGWQRFLLVQIPLTAISSATGMWLFFVQHQFENAYWQRKTDWDFHSAALFGSSHYDLPQLLHWFTGNIGFHHVHHLNSRIPNYRLQECLRNNSALDVAPRLKLMESFRCASLALWDEERGQMVSFRTAALLTSQIAPVPPAPAP